MRNMPRGVYYKTWADVPVSKRKPNGMLMETMFAAVRDDMAKGCIRLSLGSLAARPRTHSCEKGARAGKHVR